MTTEDINCGLLGVCAVFVFGISAGIALIQGFNYLFWVFVTIALCFLFSSFMCVDYDDLGDL